MITLATVRERVARLADLAEQGDFGPEASHAATDGLYVEILQAAAAGAPDAPEMAREALKVESLGLTRWYA